MNALELRGLTKHYKDFTLGPLDLTLPGGTICGLIGENGAGKSTTLYTPRKKSVWCWAAMAFPCA